MSEIALIEVHRKKRDRIEVLEGAVKLAVMHIRGDDGGLMVKNPNVVLMELREALNLNRRIPDHIVKKYDKER